MATVAMPGAMDGLAPAFLWPPPPAILKEIDAKEEPQQPEQDVPLFDLSVLADGGAACRARLAREVGQAAREWGFFQIVNHGVSLELVEHVQGLARSLFALPFERKLAGCCPGPSDGSSVGYRVGGVPEPLPRGPVLRRSACNLFLWQQNFTVFNDPGIIQHYSDRIWPDPAQAQEFSAGLGEYVMAVENVAKQMVELLTEALGPGLEQDCITRYCGGADSFTTHRLNFYPNCPEPSKSIGVVPHSDPSVLTVLHQDDVGGLEILKDGRWVFVKPHPGAFVVNVGDILQAVSNDVYPSVMHRAQVHPDTPRLSMALFYSPRKDATVAPLPQLLDSNHPPVYRPFTYAEYLALFKSRQPLNKSLLAYVRADFRDDRRETRDDGSNDTGSCISSSLTSDI